MYVRETNPQRVVSGGGTLALDTKSLTFLVSEVGSPEVFGDQRDLLV